MTWNNRIFRHPDGTFAMHEAYYEYGGDEPTSWTEKAVSEHRDTPAELIEHLEQLLRDARRSKDDVLDYEDSPPTPAPARPDTTIRGNLTIRIIIFAAWIIGIPIIFEFHIRWTVFLIISALLLLRGFSEDLGALWRWAWGREE